MNQQWKLRALLTLSLLILVSLACNLPLQEAETPAANSSDGTDYRYDNLPTPDEMSSTMSQFRAVSKWSRVDLTYIFLNGTNQLDGEAEREIIRQAFAVWAAETPLTFTETNNRNEADMEVAWVVGDHGDGDPFDRGGGILAHATFPNPFVDRTVIIHFDDDERWIDSEFEDVDLLTVAIHEIGHALGLDHSDDPDAVMYASYFGPRRTLGDDDVAGIQSLYGPNVVSEPVQPEVPPQDPQEPEAAGGDDTDGDGLSDIEEAFIIGTDFRNPDSDADGLNDGLEIEYGMNPLDADMDRDGVLDGDEVAAGSDPFFPDQGPGSNSLPPEVVDEISKFLSEAIQAEIDAFILNDPSLAAEVFAGDILVLVEDNLAYLEEQGLVQISELDYYNSYIHDIRIINSSTIEADTCEIWSTTTYRRSNGEFVSSEGPELLPQTIVIQQLNGGWFITDVTWYDAPAFCDV